MAHNTLILRKQVLIGQFFFFLCLSPVFSQVILHQQDIPNQPGTVFSFYVQNDGAGIPVEVGGRGPDQVWDFSEGPTDDILLDPLLELGDTPFAADFPTANRVTYGGSLLGGQLGDSYNYQQLNNTGWRLLGIGVPAGDLIQEDLAVVFEDPIIFMPFPAQINTDWDIETVYNYTIPVDTIPELDSLRLEFVFEGHGEIDAWGRISFPSGEVDAIRDHITFGAVINGYGIRYIFGIRIEIPLGEVYRIEPTQMFSWYAADWGEIVTVVGLPGDENFELASSIRRRFIEGEEPETFTIPLQGHYFELVSTYLVPEELDAAIVFGGIQSLAIVYEDNGHIYIPHIINTIHDITVTEGYQIFCDNNSSWTVEGVLIDPNTEYSLQTARWNWLGYPFDHPVPVTVALSDITQDISIVMTDNGRMWLPPIINTLGNILPGEGMMIFVTRNLTFRYHDAAMNFSIEGNQEVVQYPYNPADQLQPTGLPYAVLIELDETLADQVAMIEVYDGALLVGKAMAAQGRSLTPVVAWQGSTEQNLIGFTTGHPIEIVLLAMDGSVIPYEHHSTTYFGELQYASLHLTTALELPLSFTVEACYPNPFNPSVTVPFILPENGEVTFKVFNLLGQEVFSTNRFYESGRRTFLFDSRLSDVSMVSGIYFLRVGYRGEFQVRKIILLK